MAIAQRGEASAVCSVPDSPEDLAAVREQLERILSSSLFRNSKRYPNLLRYVVEQSLAGHGADLKERTLGIEVFGRAPDYDTNLDPVVRISAAEIRKRIAQYYHEPGREGEIRIDLPLGSYIPEFRSSVAAQTVALTAVAPVPIEIPRPLALAPEEPQPARKLSLRFAALLACLALGLAAAAALVVPRFRATPLDQFWGPVLDHGKPVLLCVGRYRPPGSERAAGIAFPDALTLSRLTGLIQSRGVTWHARVEDNATFTDMRAGPVVLIGLFNDSWSGLLANSMRYTFHKDADGDWIQDQRNPASRVWNVPHVQPAITKDYAIISRVIDPATDRIMISVGGLHGFGTLAAGEFLTTPKYVEAFAQKAPEGWSKKNLQIVLETEVIQGNSGPPRVLASYVW